MSNPSFAKKRNRKVGRPRVKARPRVDYWAPRISIQMPVAMKTKQIAVTTRSAPSASGTVVSFRVLTYLTQIVAKTKTPTPIENQGFIDPPRAALETGPCRSVFISGIPLQVLCVDRLPHHLHAQTQNHQHKSQRLTQNPLARRSQTPLANPP
jgi:hypothetical protein